MKHAYAARVEVNQHGNVVPGADPQTIAALCEHVRGLVAAQPPRTNPSKSAVFTPLKWERMPTTGSADIAENLEEISTEKP